MIVHASDRRGIVACGSQTAGSSRENTDRHPETVSRVTCTDCQAQLSSGWTMAESTAKLISR